MILINMHLKKGYTYESDKEAFPHLFDDNGYQTRYFYICFDADYKNILVEFFGIEFAKIIPEIKKFIAEQTERQNEYLQKTIKRQKEIETALNTLKETEAIWKTQ